MTEVEKLAQEVEAARRRRDDAEAAVRTALDAADSAQHALTEAESRLYQAMVSRVGLAC